MKCEEIKFDKASKLVRVYSSDCAWLEVYARNARVPVVQVMHRIFDRVRKDFGYSFLMKGC